MIIDTVQNWTIYLEFIGVNSTNSPHKDNESFLAVFFNLIAN